MKTTYHVPVEQFGFIELEMLETEELTQEAITSRIEAYRAISGVVKVEAGLGLPEKDFQQALDEYLSTGTLEGGTELYAQMSAEQQKTFQTLKRAFKRINYKNS